MDGENNGKPYFLMDFSPTIFGNIHIEKAESRQILEVQDTSKKVLPWVAFCWVEMNTGARKAHLLMAFPEIRVQLNSWGRER